MMNGVITFGSRDAMNLEIHSAVGDANIFLLSPSELTSSIPQVSDRATKAINFLKTQFGYIVAENNVLRDVDEFLTQMDKAKDMFFSFKEEWSRMEIVNTFRSGGFSSDVTV